ncbi:MAG: hypothetical protein ACLFU0_05395 [Alphaproteobacteria bacterium]
MLDASLAEMAVARPWSRSTCNLAPRAVGVEQPRAELALAARVVIVRRQAEDVLAQPP